MMFEFIYCALTDKDFFLENVSLFFVVIVIPAIFAFGVIAGWKVVSTDMYEKGGKQ